MRYIALVKAKRGSRERAPRRPSDLFSGSVTVEGEYWLRDPATCAILVLGTDDLLGLAEAIEACQDVFSISLLPIISVEEGLRLLGEVVGEPIMVFG